MAFCTKCGKEVSDGTKFCKYCGAQLESPVQVNHTPPQVKQRPIPEFVQAEKQENIKEQKKSHKKLILSIIAVILAIAIAFTGFIIYKKISVTGEEKLRKILEESTTKPVIEMVCKDYDSDGSYEAYAVVSDKGEEGDREYEDADIYFVNEKDAQVIKEKVNGKSNGIIATDERIYISLEVETGKDENYSYIYTAKGEDPMESEISGKYSNVHQDDGKIYAEDETGETIELKMPEGLVDIGFDNKTDKPEKTTKPEVEEETTTEPPVVDNYESDKELYKAYLTSSKVDDLLSSMEFEVGDYYEFKSCLIDLNEDNSYELLLEVTRVEGWGCGCAFAFAIQDGAVVKIGESVNWGGSGGGNNLKIKYNSQSGNHVLAMSTLANAGIFGHSAGLDVYSYNGTSLMVAKSFESSSYSIEMMAEEVNKIKSETSFYKESDGDLDCWQIDEVYVEEAEYTESRNAYIDPTDSAYQLKVGTYSNVISY